MAESACLFQRRKPYRGLERIAAGMASPQMADPAIVYMLGPFRHEDRVTALSAGVDGSWNKLACFSTQLHETSSVCIVRGSPTQAQPYPQARQYEAAGLT